MSEPFVGEVRIFAGNFAPRGWALCDGQLLAVSQNDALFSLLGTIYGGDGRTTFGLPDLRGRVPVHQGTGPGLTDRRLGSKGGAESVSLNDHQLPAHTHTLQASTALASEEGPAGQVTAQTETALYGTDAPQPMAPDSTSAVGGNQPHPNLMPYLCMNFIIALVGIYPSRH